MYTVWSDILCFIGNKQSSFSNKGQNKNKIFENLTPVMCSKPDLSDDRIQAVALRESSPCCAQCVCICGFFDIVLFGVSCVMWQI